MRLSVAVIEAMGFRPVEPDGQIVATFQMASVYEVRGVVAAFDTPVSVGGSLDDHSYSLAVGNSVNDVAKLVCGDELNSDEAAWRDKNGSAPPYLVLRVGPTHSYACSSGFCRTEPDGTLITYQAFDDARVELSDAEVAVTSRVLPAVRTCLGGATDLIRLLPLGREFFGTTPEGVRVHDVRFSAGGVGHVAKRFDAEVMASGLEGAVRWAPALNPKSSRILHLASCEDDPMKRFLYFFMAIEVLTHSTFNGIDHDAKLSELIAFPSRLSRHPYQLLLSQQKDAKSLRSRFVWAAHCAWPDLHDEDVDEFVRLKKVRDEIAHGSITQPPADAVLSVEMLALKLHSPRPSGR